MDLFIAVNHDRVVTECSLFQILEIPKEEHSPRVITVILSQNGLVENKTISLTVVLSTRCGFLFSWFAGLSK